MSAASRKVKIKLGFSGQTREVEVTVPDDHPDPWDLDSKLAVVGREVPRVDGPPKVTGRAKYTYDVNLQGLCYAKTVRSLRGSATIKSIDTSAAARVPGFLAVETLKRPGQPVRFHGDEILAVAAETEEAAEEAAAAVQVEYDPHPCVTTIEAARRDGAPEVHPGQPNVREGRRGRREEADATIEKADVVLEATYSTSVQTHSCLESHGAVARLEGDAVTAWVSTQATGAVRGEVGGAAETRNVRIVAEHVGGGFGSKFSLGVEGRLAIRLAKKVGRPVKLMLDRKEDHLHGGNRPSSTQVFKGGVRKDGTLSGLKITTYGSGGIGGGGQAAYPDFYQYGPIEVAQYDVHTHSGEGRPFRAPGHPQGFFAMESFLDELSYAVGMDPVAFRKKNCQSPIHLAEFDLGADRFEWSRRWKSKPGSDRGPKKRGAGLAGSRWSNAGGGEWRVDVVIAPDGGVEARNGTQDIGTGTRTVIAILVAEELGLRPEQVGVKLGDTNFPPGPASGGSQTAPSIGPAARLAGFLAKRELLAKVAGELGAKVGDLDLRDGRVVRKGQPTGITFADLCRRLGTDSLMVSGQRPENFRENFSRSVGGVQFAEVEVDVETGQVRVTKIVAVQDAGRVVDKLTFESQIAGGVIQGISYALFEDRRLDPNLGVTVNPDFLFYKIAGPKDCPDIEAIAFDVSAGHNSVGLMGLGEPPTIPTAAAIANAVYNAIGARVRSLPITPDRVLAALEGKK